MKKRPPKPLNQKTIEESPWTDSEPLARETMLRRMERIREILMDDAALKMAAAIDQSIMDSEKK